MLTKEQKREQSDQLRETFSGINTLFLLENHGLSVNEVNQLRSNVRRSNGTYKVVKNSVVKLAIDGTDKADLAGHLVGPKALAWTEGDPVALVTLPPLEDENRHMRIETVQLGQGELYIAGTTE